MIDCKITANYLKEKARMTNFCAIPCNTCPLSYDSTKIGEECEDFEGKYPAEAIAIVQKWSDEHPQKTRLTDFIEKFPNARLDKDGLPNICVCEIGYANYCNDDDSCKRCWNTPLGVEE